MNYYQKSGTLFVIVKSDSIVPCRKTNPESRMLAYQPQYNPSGYIVLNFKCKF